MSYVDQAVEAEIRELLPAASLRQHFAYLVEKPAACRIPGVRNLALISGLSLNPEVLFFIDDDVVHHHEHEHTCFFHWCTNTRKGAPFIATARKRGVADTHFLSRVINVLQRDDWFNFLSKQGISADDGTWYWAQATRCGRARHLQGISLELRRLTIRRVLTGRVRSVHNSSVCAVARETGRPFRGAIMKT